MQADLAFPQPLTEKYRPTRIADFVGLERPKKILSAFCKRPASGAWLFIGPSGLGKSTMAMALASELQAELHKIPSQRCNAQSIEDTVRRCWYAPMTPGGFHVVLADEADQMTDAAQLALLSKLDSTDPAPTPSGFSPPMTPSVLSAGFSLAARHWSFPATVLPQRLQLISTRFGAQKGAMETRQTLSDWPKILGITCETASCAWKWS